MKCALLFVFSSTPSLPTASMRRFSSIPPPFSPLTDTFGRFHNYLRMSLTEKCNLRCSYCMPAEGLPSLTPKPLLLSLSARKSLITLFAQLGVNKLRFTGGEPTVSTQLKPLLLHASSTHLIPFLSLTTNGLLRSSFRWSSKAMRGFEAEEASPLHTYI